MGSGYKDFRSKIDETTIDDGKKYLDLNPNDFDLNPNDFDNEENQPIAGTDSKEVSPMRKDEDDIEDMEEQKSHSKLDLVSEEMRAIIISDPKEIETVKECQGDIENQKPEESSNNQNQKADRKQPYTEYFWHCASFASQGMADVIMMSADKFTASILLRNQVFSGFASLMGIYDLMYGTDVGFSAVIASDMSKLMVNRHIVATKKYMKASIIIIFGYSCFFTAGLIAGKRIIAKLLNNDEISQQGIIDMMLSYAFYVFWSTLSFSLNGIIRGIGKDRIIVRVMYFCCIIVHFPA